jgi:alkylation response protein AidB-like acyl-CoA dehydrogenase
MSERYHPSPDQVAFADSVAKSLMSILPLSRLHQASEEDVPTWQALHELGLFDIAAPEAQGGSGLGATEEALVVLELGRRAASPAVLATLGASHLAPGEGRVTAGYRSGARTVFVQDAHASRVLVRSVDGAALYPLPKSSRVLDAQLWSTQLCETAELGAPLAAASPAQVLRLRLLDAAALAGVARAALDMAVAYAGLREQFGRAIGTFQAVKHHCANMALAARCASDQVSFAAIALDDGRADAALQVESALYVAGSAAEGNCGKNIQVHGGIGFSHEADPHLLLKRTRVLLAIAGGLEASLNRLGALPTNVEHSTHV